MHDGDEISENDEEDLIDQRQFQGWLILDWKNKDMRVLKTKPKKSQLKPYEIPIEIDITLNVPREPPKIKAQGEFDIPQTKVREIFLSEV